MSPLPSREGSGERVGAALAAIRPGTVADRPQLHHRADQWADAPLELDHQHVDSPLRLRVDESVEGPQASARACLRLSSVARSASRSVLSLADAITAQPTAGR